MGVTLMEDDDNGLGFLATCSCLDFTYRHKHVAADVGMSVETLDARAEKAFDLHSVLKVADYGVEVWKVGKHEVTFSIGDGDAGPAWYCKHVLCVFVNALAGQGKTCLSFFRHEDMLVGRTWVSLDGWLCAYYKDADVKGGMMR